MKNEKRTLSYEEVARLFDGYNIVSNMIASADFNRKLGFVLDDLSNIIKDYTKKANLLKKEVKERLMKERGSKIGIEEFPYYTTNKELSDLSIEERKLVADFSTEIEKEINILQEEKITDVNVLVLTEGDILDQEKVGKKWKEAGFVTNPNFYRYLRPVIKETSTKKMKSGE